MKTYYGTKKIKATPMGCGAYFASTNRDVPTDMDPDQAGYMVEYPGDGYQSWSPDHAFEAAYRKSGEMNFGHALEALKEGLRVCRSGWNGKGMYLWQLPAAMVKAEWCKEPHLRELAENNGGEIEALASVRMMTADGKVLTGWLASQTDMFAEDWMIVA